MFDENESYKDSRHYFTALEAYSSLSTCLVPVPKGCSYGRGHYCETGSGVSMACASALGRVEQGSRRDR